MNNNNNSSSRAFHGTPPPLHLLPALTTPVTLARRKKQQIQDKQKGKIALGIKLEHLEGKVGGCLYARRVSLRMVDKQDEVHQKHEEPTK